MRTVLTRPKEHARPHRFDAPPVVRDVLRAPGKPLDTATRGFFESRFGHDFSQVRVHNDADAAQSAFAMSARAFTVGQDLVFGSGRYAPETSAGRRLLGHELAHVAQQDHDAPSTMPDQHYDHEADRAADAALTGGQAHGFTPAAAAIQRQPEPAEKKPDLTLEPSTQTIPKSDLDKPVPAGPLPLVGLRKLRSAKPKTESESGVEASVQGSVADRKVTTNVEVAIPIRETKLGLIFGQPVVLGKDLKLEVAIGPQNAPAGLQPDVAIKISMKALWLELERIKSRIKHLKDLGVGVSAEAAYDPYKPKELPELSATSGVEASYQIGRTPLFLQGKVGYKITIPPTGPVVAAPAGDFGFKVVF